MAKMLVDYEKYEDKIPPRTLKTLRNYIENGIPTGGFLYNVLLNNLMMSYGKADIENLAALGHIIMFLHNEAPWDCHGSKDRIEEWIKKGGREGTK